MMFKKILLFSYLSCSLISTFAQNKPCSINPMYRQFDFWIGEWDVYTLKGQQAGTSKISLILDSCVILEEWTSTSKNGQLTYSGKSYNTFNSAEMQWQQHWVDNAGGSNDYLQGKYENNKMIYTTHPFVFSKDTLAIRKMTFFNLNPNSIRQLGEISKDNGKTFTIEYDLEYRRKITNSQTTFDSVLAKKLNADERGMKNYVLVILKTGTTSISDKNEIDKIFEGHMSNIGRLAKEGKLSLAGPFRKNDKTYRGLYIFNVETIEEAKIITATDPAVQSGLLDAEYFNWYGSAGLSELLPIHEKISKTKF